MSLVIHNGHKAIKEGDHIRYLALSVINNSHIFPKGFDLLDESNDELMNMVKFKDGNVNNCHTLNLAFKFNSRYRNITWDGTYWSSTITIQGKNYQVIKNDDLDFVRQVTNGVSLYFKGKVCNDERPHDNFDEKVKSKVKSIIARIESKI